MATHDGQTAMKHMVLVKPTTIPTTIPEIIAPDTTIGKVTSVQKYLVQVNRWLWTSRYVYDNQSRLLTQQGCNSAPSCPSHCMAVARVYINFWQVANQ